MSLAAVAVVLTACGTGAEDSAGSTPPVPATAEASTGALSPDGSATASVPAAGVPALLKFIGTTLEGKAFGGAGLTGSPVVFWFWAPWCPKCQAEGPAVAKTAKKYGDKVRFVGIAGLDKSKDQITEVVPGGPAATAGLRPGDVITAVDGKPTRIPEDLLAALRARDPGSTVTVSVRGPDGAARNAKMTLTDRPGINR